MRVENTEIAWLAAAFDGEGTLTVRAQWQKRGDKRYKSWRVYFQITNTCCEFVVHAADICSRLGCTSIRMYEHIPDMNRYGTQYKTAYHLQVCGMTSCMKVLDAVRPWLIVKRDFAHALLNWLHRNEDRIRFRGRGHALSVSEDAAMEAVRTKFMPKAKRTHAIGESPAESGPIPSEATEGAAQADGSVERVETRGLSPNDNDPHERPAASFPPKDRRAEVRMVSIPAGSAAGDIVRLLDESRGPGINDRGTQN